MRDCRESFDRDGAALSCAYLFFAFCAAQRLRCASAMRLRASGLSTRDFLDFAGAFRVLRSVALDGTGAGKQGANLG